MTFDHRTQQSKCTSKGYVSLGICIGWTQQEVRRWRRHWHSPCGSAPRQSAGWRSVHSGSGEVSVLLVLLWHPYRFFSLHSNLPFWSLFSACFIKVLFLYFSFLARESPTISGIPSLPCKHLLFSPIQTLKASKKWRISLPYKIILGRTDLTHQSAINSFFHETWSNQ